MDYKNKKTIINKNLKPRHSAFTFAEMMVILMIASVTLAVTLPTMTVRPTTSAGSAGLWEQVGNDIFYGTGTQGIIIGATDFAGGDPTASMLINTTSGDQNAIMFKQAGNYAGKLVVNGNTGIAPRSVGLGAVALPTTAAEGDATAVGYGAVANKQGATAFGCSANATGLNSTAVGAFANASGTESTAVGYYSLATGNYCTSVGAHASNKKDISTFGSYTVAVGYNAWAISDYAVAIGSNSLSNGVEAVSIGTYAQADGNYAVAIGSSSTLASSTYAAAKCTAVGVSARAGTGVVSITESTAIGGHSWATGSKATSVGHESQALGLNSTAVGIRAQANADYATAIGSLYDPNHPEYHTIAAGVRNTVIGSFAQSNGTDSTAIGYNTIAANNGCTAIGAASNSGYGQRNTLLGGYASIPDTALAPSSDNTALGYNAQANNSSIAVGEQSLATGINSIVFGDTSFVQGDYSIAIGGFSNEVSFFTIPSGHSIGGDYSVAVGKRIILDADSNYDTILGCNIYGTNASYSTIANMAKATIFDKSSTYDYYSLCDNSTMLNAVDVGGYVNPYSGNYSVSIGNSARAGAKGVAVGSGAYTSGNSSTCFSVEEGGFAASSSANYSTAIGVPDISDPCNTGYAAIGQYTSTYGINNVLMFHNYGCNYRTKIPGTLKIGNLANGNLYANNGIVYSSSDKRLKNIKDESFIGLNEIRKIKIYDYSFKQDKKHSPRVGVIAQELKKIFPDSTTKDNKGFYMIRQNDMFYAMINSIKQMDNQTKGIIKDLKIKIANFVNVEDKITALIKVEQRNVKQIKELEYRNKMLKAELEKLEKVR